MTFGADQNIYLANQSGQDIYTMVCENPDWVVGDVVTDVALLLVGVGEIKAATAVADLPATIDTFADLYKFLKVAGGLIGGTAAVGSRSAEAAEKLIAGFKANSIHVPEGQYENVWNQGLLSTYLNASGIAGMMGASTVTLTVLSNDGKQVAQFNTGPDDSWIATSSQSIVRSVYGTIWSPDPGAGSEPWPVQQLVSASS